MWVDPFGRRGRRGNQATRDHIDVVRDIFLRDNPGATHTGGGTTTTMVNGVSTTVQVPETFIPAASPVPGSTSGGSFADLTFEMPNNGGTVHINTVDSGNVNGMSQREWDNFQRMQANDPNATVLTVVKGDEPQNLTQAQEEGGNGNCQ